MKTPDHTIEALKAAIQSARPDAHNAARFVNIDTRVLEWLIADREATADMRAALKQLSEPSLTSAQRRLIALDAIARAEGPRT